MSDKQFRFQDLEIWKRTAATSTELFRLADELEERHLFRFAEQLRAATLSISNNIAEGSGSASDTDFTNFLNMSRRSVFETPEAFERELKFLVAAKLYELGRISLWSRRFFGG